MRRIALLTLLFALGAPSADARRFTRSAAAHSGRSSDVSLEFALGLFGAIGLSGAFLYIGMEEFE